MKKVIKIRVEKLWGYEDWLYSPLGMHQTKFEDGTLVTEGPLIKIIKANDKLSIQVHPNDEQARELENQKNGKAECWFVLDVHEHPFIVGLKTNDKKEIMQAIKNDNWDSILETTMPKKFDFINIPHGQVHGIPAKSKVLEIQQPSDITYRFYDYKRLQNGKPRELHTKKALHCINNTGWKLQHTGVDPIIYDNDAAHMELRTTPTITKNKAIVIDIKNETAYVYEANEKVTFSNKYLLINLS